ncbi:MAG: hypothetical protein ABUL60_08180 [Myxococcales bacterium]
MTIPQPLRKFAGLAFCVALSGGLSGCSSNIETPDGTAGTSSVAGSSTSAGTSGSSSMTAGTNGGGAPSTGSNEVVGTFQVQIQVDEADSTKGMTKIVGQVGDGPVPANVVWTVAKEEGGCRLETPKSPFCDGGCGSDVCVADGKCQAYPTGHSVGAVTLKGVQLVGGGSEIALKEIAKAYQPPSGTMLAYPPFAQGDDISVHAEGGDYAAFDLATKGVDPLSLTSTDFELEEDKALTLTWDAPSDPKSAQVYVKVDISHHGGAKGKIECDVDDTGSLTISPAMMTQLIGLGVAGYPSVVVMRQSIDSAKIAPGLVRLEVSARTEQYLTVKGYTSCTVDEDCPTGKTCRTSDSTCQ